MCSLYNQLTSTRDFFAILGRSPRAFQIGKKLARQTPKLGNCYSAQLCHFLSIKKQISFYTYYCH